MSDPANLRQHVRTDFLAAQHDADSLPGWVFKPVQFSQGPAGLVLNMSDGGLQVLTSAAEPVTEDKYEVVLLLGRSDMDDEDEQVSWFNGVVERKWSPAAHGANHKDARLAVGIDTPYLLSLKVKP